MIGVADRKTMKVSMFVCCKILMLVKRAAKKHKDTPKYEKLFFTVKSERLNMPICPAATITRALKASCMKRR